MYLQWLRYRHAVIDVEHNERYEGKSSYNLKKRIGMTFDILTSQSDNVLKLMIKFGMTVSMLSLVAIIGIVIHYFTSNVSISSTGWSSLIVVVSLVGGLLMASLEYT